MAKKKKNHCTLFPDSTWGKCCKKHDEAYAMGGCSVDRKVADKALKKCVQKCSKGWLIPNMMYVAVRTFGSNYWPHFCKPKHLCWKEHA